MTCDESLVLSYCTVSLPQSLYNSAAEKDGQPSFDDKAPQPTKRSARIPTWTFVEMESILIRFLWIDCAMEKLIPGDQGAENDLELAVDLDGATRQPPRYAP